MFDTILMWLCYVLGGLGVFWGVWTCLYIGEEGEAGARHSAMLAILGALLMVAGRAVAYMHGH